ncbi:MAG: ribosome biogenesis GTP-binding protein YihA/YsxC [Deltaproteobacteria bacterium]|nr:ribosome biogenesis GTP-binding protein YihA/YsxC [Deltaproteobacteria bacterium]
MKITQAEFIISAAKPAQFPGSDIPEVAFVGKSNVGKSSLINSLLGRKNLVKTSSTPGKTQLINFFLINGSFHFVDLPGYGFAKAPRQVREGWEKLVGGYLSARPTLKGVVVILDIRHPPGELDLRMKNWLEQAGLPVIFVANKSDKLSRGRLAGHAEQVALALGLEEPPLAVSAKSGLGCRELWERLESWIGTAGKPPPVPE